MPDAINVLDVFYSCYAVILAVSQTYVVQLLYHVSNLLPIVCENDLSNNYHVSNLLPIVCKHVNNLSINYRLHQTTPKLLASQLLFALFNYG